jgi:tRNA pseudouridine55 synthase
MKRRAGCLPVHGVLLLDKPAGLTSNQALQTAKRLLNACKAGHTGALDPIATGLLPLTFGDATRISQFLLEADKRYRTVFKLGESTNTYDAEGEVTQVRSVDVTRAQVRKVLERFTGEIEQLPPMFSAVKLGGVPLYKLARAGQDVARAPRRVVIRRLELLELRDDRLTLEIVCSKGTYIRTLAHDIGEALGCGAHIAALRRQAVGGLSVEDAVTLEALEALPTPEERAGLLKPVDAVLHGLPDVHLTPLAAFYLRQGQAVSVRHGRPPGWVRLYEGEDRFLGLGEVLDDGRVAPRRLMGAGKFAEPRAGGAVEAEGGGG